jgi:hypothetical protein
LSRQCPVCGAVPPLPCPYRNRKTSGMRLSHYRKLWFWFRREIFCPELPVPGRSDFGNDFGTRKTLTCGFRYGECLGLPVPVPVPVYTSQLPIPVYKEDRYRKKEILRKH